MRTNIVLDDKLVEEVIDLYGFPSKKKAVEEGLKTLLYLKRQEKVREYRGKLAWEGNLAEIRRLR